MIELKNDSKFLVVIKYWSGIAIKMPDLCVTKKVQCFKINSLMRVQVQRSASNELFPLHMPSQRLLYHRIRVQGLLDSDLQILQMISRHGVGDPWEIGVDLGLQLEDVGAD